MSNAISFHHLPIFSRTKPSPAEWLVRDARHFQIVFLLSFLLLGLTGFSWDLKKEIIAVQFSVCLFTQFMFTSFTNRDYRSLKSAMISALSLCLMLRTDSVATAVLASFLSIASKFLFTVKTGEGKKKHFFNPTNFGICISILVTQHAWISPGQWGSNALLILLIGVLGFTVLMKVHRIDTALFFLFTFASLLFIRSYFVLGWETDSFLHSLTSGTLWLFAFFMITDPASTPSHPGARMFWAACIGALAFYLSAFELVNGAPVWALFFLSPFTIVLDKIFVHSKFSWL